MDEITEKLKRNGRYIKFVENPTYEQCEIAVKQNPNAIRDITYVKKSLFDFFDLSKRIQHHGIHFTNYLQLCEIALKQKPLLIKFLPQNVLNNLIPYAYQYDQRILLYVKIPQHMYNKQWENGEDIAEDYFGEVNDIQVARKIFHNDVRYGDTAKRLNNAFDGIFRKELNELSYKKKIKYLKKSRLSSILHYFDNPTEEMQWRSLKSCQRISYINNPTRDMLKYAIERNSINSIIFNDHIEGDIELEKLLIENHPLYIKYFDNLPDELFEIFYERSSLHDIINVFTADVLSDDQIIKLIYKRPVLINRVKNLSDKIIEEFFESDEITEWTAMNIYDKSTSDIVKTYLVLKYGITK